MRFYTTLVVSNELMQRHDDQLLLLEMSQRVKLLNIMHEHVCKVFKRRFGFEFDNAQDGLDIFDDCGHGLMYLRYKKEDYYVMDNETKKEIIDEGDRCKLVFSREGKAL